MRRAEQIEQIARDCVHFKGDRPCRPHQKQGHTCRCPLYSPRTAKILIIELSSAARLVRSLALLARLKADAPHCRITYLTSFPELLGGFADEGLKPDAAGIFRLQMEHFDLLCNLDPDKRACAVTNLISADRKKGFYLHRGDTTPLDEDSFAPYLQAIMPHTANTPRPGRLAQLFLMCNLQYRRETPRLTAPATHPFWPSSEGPIIGLYTPPEPSRVFKPYWEESRWVNLIETLRCQGITPVLLGDTLSHRFNEQIAQNTDITYPGPLTLSDQLIALSQCDVVVSAAETVQEMTLALGGELVILDCHCDPEIDLTYARDRFTLVPPNQNPAHSRKLSEILPDEVLQAVLNRLSHLAQQKKSPQIPGNIESFPSAERTAIRNFVSQSRTPPT